MNGHLSGKTGIQNLRLLALGVLMAVMLSACGAEKAGETVSVPPEISAAPEAAPEAAPGAAPEAAPEVTQTPGTTPVAVPLTQEEQEKLIDEWEALWAVRDAYESWYYARTDLDHNGRLELIAASEQGTGHYTYADFWEVSEDYSRLVRCETSGEEGESWPDFIRDTLTCYYDETTGRYYYVCEDLVREDAAHYRESVVAFWLKDGRMEQRTLAVKTTAYVLSDPEVSYADAEGNPIREDEYETAADRFFLGMEKSLLPLVWTGESSRPALEETPGIKITKQPRSERLAAGGRTWFIAHAENAESISWQLLDPAGTVYTLQEAMEANPGLQLEELELDTIAVGNVPQSLDGWGIQAIFRGPDGMAVTDAAYITVENGQG